MTGLERIAGRPLEVVLVEHTDHAVVVADAGGVIRFWNPAAEAVFGHPRAAAVGASLDLIIPEPLRGRHWEGYRRVMATGETEYAGRTLAVPAIRADGTRISVEFTVTLLRDDHDAVSGSRRSSATSPRSGRSSARCAGAWPSSSVRPRTARSIPGR